MASTQGMLNLMFLLLLLASFPTYTRDTNLISCGSTFCRFGEPASVTCKFHKHIIESKLNVSVERFVDGNNPGINVLNCTWKQDEKFDCKTAPGYSLDKNIAETLTLRIPNATKAVVGTYKCQVIPPDGTLPHVCNFPDLGENTTRPMPNNKCKESGVLCAILLPIALASMLLNACQWFFGRSKKIVTNDPEAQPLLGFDQPFTPTRRSSEIESCAYFQLSQRETLIDAAGTAIGG
ncbi:uncharacterized protein [Littorina saxatilis]|uniref:Ig-like domain-containing protein n=1 Tax=Littorina saxatilis TaxID=31220 RepID=A0AAN9GES9_9CAEN